MCAVYRSRESRDQRGLRAWDGDQSEDATSPRSVIVFFVNWNNEFLARHQSHVGGGLSTHGTRYGKRASPVKVNYYSSVSE